MYSFSFCVCLSTTAPGMLPLKEVKARNCNTISAEDGENIFKHMSCPAKPKGSNPVIDVPDYPCMEVWVSFTLINRSFLFYSFCCNSLFFFLAVSYSVVFCVIQPATEGFKLNRLNGPQKTGSKQVPILIADFPPDPSLVSNAFFYYVFLSVIF